MLFDIESEDRQRRAFQIFDRGDRADGLLIVSLIPPEDEVERLRVGAAARRAGRRAAPAFPAIVVDDVDGGEMATTHLVELGHRRIAFVGDKPPDPFRFDSSRDRTRGYERALAHAGIELRPEYVREGTQSRHVARAHRGRAARLPERRPRSSPPRTRRRSACSKPPAGLGMRVPEELSVIGFDDIEIAAYVGLTTVRQPLFESGRRGGELLLEMLAGAGQQLGEHHTEQLPLQLVIRSTTGPMLGGVSEKPGARQRLA